MTTTESKASTTALYQQAMLTHHQTPIGFEKVIKVDQQQLGENAFCGDEINLMISCDHQHISDIAFSGDSCAICRASASILCQSILGLSFHQAFNFIKQTSQALINKDTLVNSLAPLNGVKQYPVRLQCALLPWQTLTTLIESKFFNSDSPKIKELG
ncbi:Fe-S cluster assembly sulfur transfer protein SufU [Thalassotalea sp. PLHSN55]|uniref:Fe-S cluster assembly sulfur transfer protein SufU n=1 Tax=Thalassotalea sp. PLHSN55 TaxID=3435888 RepID=UPI003F84C3C9